jgi:hypothetical protein
VDSIQPIVVERIGRDHEGASASDPDREALCQKFSDDTHDGTLQPTFEIQVLQCDKLRGVLGRRHGGLLCCKSAAGADEWPSLILARLAGAIRGLGDGAEFGEGHQVDPEWAAKVPAKRIGRMPMLPRAKRRQE